MAHTIPASDPPVTPVCIGCGYDLRAQPADGKCPECGTDVDRSMHGFWLRYSDQQWVAAVLRGLNWVWANLAVFVGAGIATALLLAIVFLVAAPTSSAMLNWLVFALVVLIAIGFTASAVGFASGLWLATASEPVPQNAPPLRAWSLRILSLALIPALAAAVTGTRWLTAPVVIPAWVESVTAIAAVSCIGVQSYQMLGHLRSLEHRCSGFEAFRESLLQRYRRNVALFSTLLIILVLVTSLGRSTFGAGLMFFVWLAAVGQVGETRKRIQAELSILSAREEIEAHKSN